MKLDPSEIASLDRAISESAHRFLPATIFSPWGIGRNEVNTSKQLAFFMSSHYSHRLQSAFVGALCDCTNGALSGLAMDDISATLEVFTKERNKIDLLLRGRGWLLAIENKIEAATYNDFASYKNHCEAYPEARKEYVVLSRDGNPPDGWTGVDYRRYIQALSNRLGDLRATHAAEERWLVHAEDFLQELRNWIEKPGHATRVGFVRQIMKQAGDAEGLWSGYLEFLRAETIRSLNQAVTGAGFNAWIDGPTGWVIKCHDPVGRWDYFFHTPLHYDGNPERCFLVGVWAYNLTNDQREAAHRSLDRDYLYAPYDGSVEGWEQAYNDRESAMNGLCDLARRLAVISP